MSAIQIRPADLTYAGELLKADFSDEERSAALSRTDSVDVWACPGSGKTTLLVGKLAIFGRQWRDRTAGVCVLSHTNVAKREIERRLARTASLSILRRPHYIGTIQSFVHTFLSYPAAELKFGTRPTVVDDDATALALRVELQRPEYVTARSWLHHGNRFSEVVSSLRFSAPDLSIQTQVKRFVGPQTDTYKQLERAKHSLAERGWFCYSDMFALAEWYFKQCPAVCDFLSLRFPYVFIDEMQDTNGEQWRVLRQVFEGKSIIQRFGDNKQAIFDDRDHTKDTGFPSEPKCTISYSHRFSTSIARLARLFSEDGIELRGNPNRPDLEHGIILFSPETILDVLPYFATEVKRQLGSYAEFAIVKAIGATGQSSNPRIPAQIGHYWPSYQPNRRVPLSLPSCTAEYIQDAVLAVQETGQFEQVISTMSTGILAALKLQDIDQVSLRNLRTNELTSFLRTNHPDIFLEYANFLMKLPTINPAEAIPSELRSGIVARVVEVLSQRELLPETRAFLRQQLNPDRLRNHIIGSHQNIYDAGDGLFIELSTIHSVKGETHDATLLLETQSYTPDLSSILAYLYGQRSRKPGKRIQAHLRRLYVGATRPRALLFLAMPQHSVGKKDRPKLEKAGWKLHDL